MKTLKKTWFIALVLTLVLVVGVQYFIKAQGTEASALSAKEIRTQIEEVYDGEILAFTINGDKFEATIAKEGAEYALEGSAASGQVYSLIQTREIMIADSGEKDITEGSEDAKKTEETTKENEQNAQPEQDEPKEKDVPNEQPQKEAEKPAKKNERSPTRITAQEAGQIGLNELPKGMVGEIDDIDFVSTDQGGYYLVEIELDDDYHDDYEYDEVIYQIHAISGEIMTTTWDD